ncbi:unnamed protein product [Ceratitis capitata]|uniref:(Mediterranean fruit fly) hypothetical protein n=1 Tax=Ceratitis capitata TaxID=7213 RepID=A0A811UG08_CERCA|nr:unnamed protein product [Ceratitis capitata]
MRRAENARVLSAERNKYFMLRKGKVLNENGRKFKDEFENYQKCVFCCDSPIPSYRFYEVKPPGKGTVKLHSVAVRKQQRGFQNVSPITGPENLS